MNDDVLVDNDLRSVRIEAGFETEEEFAAAVDIDPTWYGHIEAGHVVPTRPEFDRILAVLNVPASRVYSIGSRNLIGGQRTNEVGYSVVNNFHDQEDQCHLLVGRDEISWFERQPGRDHKVDVFVNLSCGTQLVPHLLRDTVAVLERLDVNFLAAAGPAACCGKPFTNADKEETAEQVNLRRINRSVGWGATVHVNWCIACQMICTTKAANRYYSQGVEHPVREVQVLTFLEERIRELGDRVPWKKRLSRRVAVVGHSQLFGPMHKEAHEVSGRLLSMVPGVEVVALHEGHSDNSPCTASGRDRDWEPPAWIREQDAAEGVRAHRKRLAAEMNALGADTAANTHQTCHWLWSRYASDQLAVIHPVSIVAEALGCDHPDRTQAAIRLGDPDGVVEQTRSVWQSWGMSEERARELAVKFTDPKFADEASQCRCGDGGGGSCRENLISIDVLAGSARAV